MADILPLIPMTARQVALMSPEEQRDYWLAVCRVWSRNATAAQDRECQLDHDDARRDGDWA